MLLLLLLLSLNRSTRSIIHRHLRTNDISHISPIVTHTHTHTHTRTRPETDLLSRCRKILENRLVAKGKKFSFRPNHEIHHPVWISTCVTKKEVKKNKKGNEKNPRKKETIIIVETYPMEKSRVDMYFESYLQSNDVLQTVLGDRIFSSQVPVPQTAICLRHCQ